MKKITTDYCELIILRVIIFLFFTSSFIFIILTNENKFDESFHLIDINNYFSHGINIKSLKNHTTPTGPGSHIWATFWGKLFGYNIITFRFSVWFCWLFIYILLEHLFKEKRRNTNTVALLLFSTPYAPTLAGLLMTEAFGLFCALMGTLLLIISFKVKKHSILLITSTLFMGIAIISRLYFLCLAPSFFMLMFQKKLSTSLSFTYSSILIANIILIFPFLSLCLIWGGIIPPSYYKVHSAQNLHLALNFPRFISVLMYLGAYLSPIITLQLIQKEIKIEIKTIIILLIISVFIFSYVYVWNIDTTFTKSGLINYIDQKIRFLNPTIGYIFYFFSIFISIFSLYYFNKNFKSLKKNDIIIFCYYTIVFFLILQIFISGNNPFYERYLIHILPFLWIICGNMKFKKTILFYVFILAGIFIGQLALWRWYFE
ncbi:hypothetical protein FHS57_001487 [Runella defluvii]|uniref:Glycosyltransferase RgtA/B/C/D-like domain-containing protein n=1 Tax=Runella defluvii TaxID=370973 RepID=A0A7W6EPH8_9BACT|nr:hypothetical protein [Runella defluvii]MBB3837493.1 hypothetical protein [Runella defluvii]